MATSARQKLSEMMNEEARGKTKRRQEEVVQVEEREEEAPSAEVMFKDIAANPFVQIMQMPVEQMSIEQKKKEIAKLRSVTAETTKEEAVTNLAAYEQFKAYLQHQRTEMARELIRLADTRAFAELQAVYDQMNNDLLAFEEKLKPLTEILDAISRLRADGKTFDAFVEIRQDKEDEIRRKEEQEKQEQDVVSLRERIDGLQKDVASLNEDKGLFGWGNVRKASRVQIALKEVDISNAKSELDGLIADIQRVAEDTLERTSSLGEHAADKAKLRELLDLTAEEHTKRQTDLVQSADKYVLTSQKRFGTVLEHLKGVSGQIQNIDDSNSSTTAVYEILHEADKDAKTDCEGYRKTLAPPQAKEGEEAVTESEIDRGRRERRLEFVEEHISALGTSAGETLATLANLRDESLRVKSMKKENVQRINSTKAMQSAGIAGVASRLSIVVNGVSAAAMHEASEGMAENLKRMNDMTRNAASQGALRVAMGTLEENDKLSSALDEYEKFRTDYGHTREVVGTALREQQELNRKMEQEAKDLQEELRKSISLHADVMAAGAETTSPSKANDNRKKTAGSAAPALKFGLGS